MTEGGWRPILTGEEAREARRVALQIAGDARAWSADLGPSLPDGDAGIALLHAYLDRSFPDREQQEAAEARLESAIESIASRPSPPAFHGGFPGVGWVVEHLLADEEDGEDLNEEIDRAIAQALEGDPSHWDYDLISGLVGIGFYALERLENGRGAHLLEKVVARLDATAERDGDRITWFTPASRLPEWQRERCPGGYHNLGVAHGVPGIVALLGQAAARGDETARRLAGGGVRWISSVLLPEDRAGRLPAWLCTDEEPAAARLAWCYGDLGAAAAVLSAAEHAGEPEWRELALELARAAARRPPERAAVRDAGICHGSAGNAHVFNRLWQATGDAELERAARFWFRRTLELRGDGPLAGYSFYKPRGDEEPWVTDPCLLTGAGGVALALLAAITDEEPAWDRCLAIDVPVLGGRRTDPSRPE